MRKTVPLKVAVAMISEGTVREVLQATQAPLILTSGLPSESTDKEQE